MDTWSAEGLTTMLAPIIWTIRVSSLLLTVASHACHIVVEGDMKNISCFTIKYQEAGGVLSLPWPTLHYCPPGLELGQVLLHGSSIPAWAWYNLFSFQKWFGGCSFYRLTPELQPFPIVHTYYSFAKQMEIFPHWRHTGKNFLPGRKGNFSCPFSAPFCNAGTKPTSCVLLSFLCMRDLFFFFCTVPEEKDFSVLTSCSLLHTFECSLLKASYLYTGTKYIPLTPCGITLHADCWALERWIECMTESFL